jgi:hypothetical protein
MSKARRPSADKPTKQLCFFPDAPLRTVEQIDADVIRALSGFSTGLPGEVVKALRKVADGVTGKYSGASEWDTFKMQSETLSPRMRSAIGGLSKLENEFIGDLVVRAAESGFWLALQRYSRHLRGSDEAMAFIKARRKAGDTGRAKQSARKQTRQAEAKAMQDAGVDEKAIAAHFRVDRSTVYRWLQPAASPPASKTKTKPKRK